jgi:hypothetical protein
MQSKYKSNFGRAFPKSSKGWRNESARHSLASRGVRTGSRINYAFGGLPPFKQLGEEERKRISSDFTKELGDSIARDIKALNNKYIRDVAVEDFTTDSGYITVLLNMKDFPAIKKGKYYFEDDDKRRALREVSAVIRKVLSKHKGVVNISGYSSPNITYDEYGGFDGYDNDVITFDYATLGYAPKLFESKVSLPKSQKSIMDWAKSQNKLSRYINRELKGFEGNWNPAGKDLVKRTLLKEAKTKKDVDEIIMDSLWYNAEDFVRIHH